MKVSTRLISSQYRDNYNHHNILAMDQHGATYMGPCLVYKHTHRTHAGLRIIVA